MSSPSSSQPLPFAEQPYESQSGFSEADLTFEEKSEERPEEDYFAPAEEPLQRERTYRKSAQVVGKLVIGGLIAALVALGVGASLYASRYTESDDALPSGAEGPGLDQPNGGLNDSTVPLPPAIEPGSSMPAQPPAAAPGQSPAQPVDSAAPQVQPAQPVESAAPVVPQAAPAPAPVAPAPVEPQVAPAPAAN
jgi:hypothetical protein